MWLLFLWCGFCLFDLTIIFLRWLLVMTWFLLLWLDCMTVVFVIWSLFLRHGCCFFDMSLFLWRVYCSSDVMMSLFLFLWRCIVSVTWLLFLWCGYFFWGVIVVFSDIAVLSVKWCCFFDVTVCSSDGPILSKGWLFVSVTWLLLLWCGFYNWDVAVISVTWLLFLSLGWSLLV